MAEGRRNSVEMPLSKTLVALKRVRSLRDPDTNSMGKFAMGIENINLDVHSCQGDYVNLTNSDRQNFSMHQNVHINKKMEDVGSNSDSEYASSKKSSTVKMKSRVQNRQRTRHKKTEEEEVNSYSESRTDEKSEYNRRHNWRKPSKTVEVANMSRVGSPSISMSEAHTHCMSQSFLDSNYSGCGISYCWSRTPKYTLSPDMEAEENPLLYTSMREGASREIVPYLESPRSLSQKYRPKSFNELVGLSSVAKSLLYAVLKGKISPVYLFHGPRGTGKTSTARIFSAALNCISPDENRPCGFCRECVFCFSKRSRDIKELDAVKLNHKDRVKSLLKSASMAPFSSQFKVFIIDECQYLRAETWASIFNCVEYISRHSIFVMITTDLEKLPHISLSQCQRYHFPKINSVDICLRLQKICVEEGFEFDKDALDLIASKCEGSLRDAETIIDQLGLLGKRITLSLAYELIGIVSDEELLDLLDLALSSDTTNTVKRARDLMKSKVDPMQLLSQLANVVVDILSGRSQAEVTENGSKRHFLAEVSMQRLRRALNILSETEKQLRSTKNQATWLTVALLQFSTEDDMELGLGSPRDSLKIVDCNEDNKTKSCSETQCPSTELETIWRRAVRRCQSNSLRSFLEKEANLSSIHVDEGLAIAEIEFYHPDHVSRAEKSWKLIATSLQLYLKCDVQLRLKLIPTYTTKTAKQKKSSFRLLNCSGRNQQMSDSSLSDERESEIPSRGETFIKAPCSHDKEDTLSSKCTSDKNDCKSHLCSPSVDVVEHESQPNCFAKTLKLPKKLLRVDNSRSRLHQHSKQELPNPNKMASEAYFNTYETYGYSGIDLTCNESKSRSKLLCWRPPTSSPRKVL